ncbi:Hsp20/alpha crystallin family protein [Bacillus taeanensis]|uniref:Hsp20/alpha crystallin family protein n=1 Tax=Bacillus taeanensis TaxID=273032 RepID=A0A366XY78_9BACI|nr:Hsp20/alpha crystallin family protein [Bacillus taeanensis]RBW69103.1 Hsp20/alpha crystallin family protein [Bacillus taeanensis]
MEKKKGRINWSRFSENIDQVLGEDFWNDLHHVIPKRGPSFDMYETKTEGVIIVELPGMTSMDNIQIRQNGTELILHGNIGYTYPVEQEKLLQNERFSGKFKRVISVPFHYKAEDIKAQYKNGLLEIRIQKAAQEEDIIINIEE